MLSFYSLSFLLICVCAPALGSVILCLFDNEFTSKNLLFGSDSIPIWVFAPLFVFPFTLVSFGSAVSFFTYLKTKSSKTLKLSIFLSITISSLLFPIYLFILPNGAASFLIKNTISCLIPGLCVAAILSNYAVKKSS